MDLIILLKLAQLFTKRVQTSNNTNERNFCEDRATSLSRFALFMFRTKNNSRSVEPFRRLFKYGVGNSFFEIDTEINRLTEEAITFLADQRFKMDAYEECIEDLAGIKLPYATYFQAASYRKLAESGDIPKNKRAYLEKAKECLKQTLDLLDGPNVAKNHALKSIVDEDIKRLQSDSRKLDTSQCLTDSFVSANGRSDLDESLHNSRIDRDVATPVAGYSINNENVERLLHQVIESVATLCNDVAFVRNDVDFVRSRFSNIEEFYISNAEELRQLREELRQNNMNMSTMANASQTQSKNDSMHQAQGHRNPLLPTPHSPMMSMNNSYGMSPMLYNEYGMSPYHTSLLNAATQATQPQMRAGMPGISPFANDPYAASLLQQHALVAQQILLQNAQNSMIGAPQSPAHGQMNLHGAAVQSPLNLQTNVPVSQHSAPVQQTIPPGTI